ncbi:MAG: Flp family type IVb pilin [Armatimonadota bacterium]
MKLLKELLRDEEGLTTVEYALLLALVVVAGIVAWGNLGTAVTNAVTESADTISGASS